MTADTLHVNAALRAAKRIAVMVSSRSGSYGPVTLAAWPVDADRCGLVTVAARSLRKFRPTGLVALAVWPGYSGGSQAREGEEESSLKR